MKSSWTAPALLADVPADTPYVIATLQPLAPAVRDRMRDDARDRLAKFFTEHPQAEAAPGGRILRVLQDALARGPAAWADIGLDPGGQFVVYGLAVWPVARMVVVDPARARAFVAKLVAAAGDFESATLQGHAYWKRTFEGYVVVLAVGDHDVTFTALPIAQLDRALPYALGLAHPAHPLSTSTLVPEVLARHHLNGILFAYGDIVHLFDMLTGQGHGELDALAGGVAGSMSPQCHEDAMRLISLAPRVAFGYRRYDEHGFDARLVLESPARVVRPLEKLRTAMPPLTLRGEAMVAFGAAVDVDGTLVWLRDLATAVRDQPFRCPELAKLDDAAQSLLLLVDRPLPPMLHGLRGAEIEIDDVVTSPPSGTGHAILAGDHVGTLVAQTLHGLPMLGSVHVAPDGAPVALPVEQIVPWLAPAHLAMHEDRAVLAVGRDSAARATAKLAAPAGRAPLFTVIYDLPRYRDRLAPLIDHDRSSFDSLGGLGKVALSFDVEDAGIVLDIAGTWAAH